MVRLVLVVCCGWAAVGLGVKTSAGDDWREQSVPGEWSTETATRVADAGGVGWYRSWMLPHPSCFGKAPNDLASESVGLNLSGLAGGHRAFVNGRDIGSGEGAGIHRHKIPAGVLQAGQWNEIAIRVTVPSGEARAGGFADEAPFVMSYFHECVLAGSWMFAVGDAVGRTAGPLPERPGAAAFDTFTESSRVLGRTAQVAGPRLEPKETAARMRTADPYRIELLLHEPLVAQPFHVSFDERGRMWVTQSRQYPYPAGVRMISRDKYYRSHYDRVPPAPPSHDRGADVISVHESSRRDGVYDRHTVYLDGLNMASASLHGRGGTWVMHTPHLLFYPDADGNGPDGDPEVRLTGFGLEDSHAIANGLCWGPDGWLYGAQGSTTSCLVRRPGLDTDKAGAAFTGAMIWRYHPDTLAFEIIAEGGGNTFGVEFDEFGRLFSGHNGGGTRGFHYVPGGLYRTPDVDPGKYGPPANPHAYGELPAMATVDAIPRFTHFGAFAVGTGLPVTARGHLFALDPLHNLVTDTALVPRGSTFSTRDAEPAVRCEDPAFRPVYVATAPDGSLVVCDMYDFYVAHGQHYQNQIDSSTGRIWRLRGRDADLETDTDLSSRSSADLVEILDHDNGWHRRTAVRLLGERKDSGIADDLASRVASLDPREAVHVLWALHQAGGAFPSDTDDDGRSAIEKAIASPHAAVRGWAVRLLGDDYGVHRGPGLGGHAGRLGHTSPGRLPDGLQKRLLKLARKDADAEVLVQLASTARRLDREQALELIAALLGRPGFGDDPFLPMMGWWVLEALYDTGDSVANEPLVRVFEMRRAGSAPARGFLPGDPSDGRVDGRPASLISQDSIAPTVARRLARRLAADGSRGALLLVARLIAASPDRSFSAAVLAGFEEAFQGRPIASLPQELIDAIATSGGESLAFRLRRGEVNAITDAIGLVRDRTADVSARLTITRTLGEVGAREAVDPLVSLAGDTSEPSVDVRVAALAALGTFDDADLADRIVRLLPMLDGRIRDAACVLLSARTAWSIRLLDAIEAGTIDADHVPDDVATRLRLERDEAIRSRVALLLPERAHEAGSARARIDDLRGILAAGQGNPYAGEATFIAKCAQCHRLFHKGGQVGPDLTTYQRDDLGTMLLSIIDPSAEIREGFRYEVVVTDDGRSLGGFFVERDDRFSRLRTVDGETITLDSEEIAEREPLGRSIMPAGLLDGLDDQTLRDFFAYLRIRQPITR